MCWVEKIYIYKERRHNYDNNITASRHRNGFPRLYFQRRRQRGDGSLSAYNIGLLSAYNYCNFWLYNSGNAHGCRGNEYRNPKNCKCPYKENNGNKHHSWPYIGGTFIFAFRCNKLLLDTG